MQRSSLIKNCQRFRKPFLVLCAVILVLTGLPFLAYGETTGTAKTADPVVEETVVSEAAETTEETAPEQTPEEGTTTESGGSVAAVAALSSIALASATSDSTESGNVGTLDVQLSNADGGFDNISTFENSQADWPINTLRTLKVNFEFSSGSNKAITINVPAGYVITGYSATDDTPAITGVQSISIDPEYKDFFQSSSLKATDGISDWDKQALKGYTAQDSPEEEDIPLYGGTISYSFLSSATKGEIMVTLTPQSKSLTYTTSTQLMDSIDVTMSSSVGTNSDSFQANITNIPILVLKSTNEDWGQISLKVPVDTETGRSEQFGILTSLWVWNSYHTWVSYPVDDWSVTITYPKGVSYDYDAYLSTIGVYTCSETGTLANGHAAITVTGDKTTGGTVTLAFHNTTIAHGGSHNDLGAFFTVDTNVEGVSSEDTLTFPVELSFQDDGRTYSHSITYTRQLVADDGKYQITLKAANETHRDIHAEYPTYDEEILLGRFYLHPQLPYSNVPIFMDFTDLVGVRSVALPGYDIHDIIVTTTNGRTVTVDSLSGTALAYKGIPLTAEILGLSEGEYIQTLTFTSSLEQLNYGYLYNYAFSYCGEFAEHKEGDVVLSILDQDGNVALNNKGKELTITDHTKFGWNESGASALKTIVSNSSSLTETDVFEPNDTIYFYGRIFGGSKFADCTTIIDPIVMISLPEGINLDTTSVQAASAASNGKGKKVSLVQVGVPKKQVIDGIEWTTHYYTSAKPLDMVARELIPGTSKTDIRLYCQASVASNAPAYGQISLKDVIQWDLHHTLENDAEAYPRPDIYNRAGKGTDYILSANGANFAVKPLIGWNADLGIRVANSDTNFSSYDGTDASVTAVTPSDTDNAEICLSHANTGSSDYLSGSSIYLPIPKKGVDYSQFFENKTLTNPAESPDTATFEYTTYLASQVALPGFDTYYAVERTETTEAYDPTTNAGTWVPITATWYTYDQLLAAGHDLSDVVMLKLISTSAIATGGSSETTFQLQIDDSAKIGELNFWRAYYKGVSEEDGSGVWRYSPVLAATPASAGINGQFFIDEDANGFFNNGESEADSAYTNGQASAILTKDGGGMDNLALTVASDGSFRTLNANGSTYYLKAGSYTVTFTSADPVYHFSEIPGSQPSDGTNWYNDIDVASLTHDEEAATSSATYRFTIDENSDYTTYLGVALTDFVDVISVNVPMRVNLAVDANGTWCTPTALDNKIINHSTCAMRVSSVSTQATDGFKLVSNSALALSELDNVFAGTLTAGNSAAQDLTRISTSGDDWVIPLGFTRLKETIADGSNELPIQLTGKIQQVSEHFLTAPVNVFDITYTFERV